MILHLYSGCRDGAHIEHCSQRQCGGHFKCPQSYCIPLKRVCDGVWDCSHGDDELHCDNFHCPNMYQCKADKICLRQSQVMLLYA